MENILITGISGQDGIFLTKSLLDKNEELIKFAQTLENVCIQTVENGEMTKDLAILISKDTKYLTTNEFLEAIDKNLKKQLN